MSRKHMLVTAPELYAKRFRDAFEQSDAQGDFDITYLPLISTQRLEDLSIMQIFLMQLHTYDFIAFCSRKAIECFADYTKEFNISIPESVNLIAIGRDNEALGRSLNKTPLFIASEPSPQGIINWFTQHPNHKNKKIAVLAPVVQGLTTPDTVPMFIEGLKGEGLNVTEVGCYITKESIGAHQKLREITPSLDCVAFSSGAEVEVFIRSVGVENRNLRHLVFGPYTASYAKKMGIKIDLTNQNFEDFGQFIKNIKAFYNHPPL